MTDRDPHFWVGYLSTAIAHATTDPDPKPILQSAMKSFLQDRPPGDELGDNLRRTLKEKP